MDVLRGAGRVVARRRHLLIPAVYGELAMEVVTGTRQPRTLNESANLERVAGIGKAVDDRVCDLLWEFTGKLHFSPVFEP